MPVVNSSPTVDKSSSSVHNALHRTQPWWSPLRSDSATSMSVSNNNSHSTRNNGTAHSYEQVNVDDEDEDVEWTENEQNMLDSLDNIQ